MILALDSSALLCIFNNEPGADAWLEALVGARRQGPLIVCEVVYAELAPAFPEQDELQSALSRLGAWFDPIQSQAAWLTGSTFKTYRRAGGPREPLIPDFLIAAHAQVQADRLAATDRGYLRKYFPELALLRP